MNGAGVIYASAPSLAVASFAQAAGSDSFSAMKRLTASACILTLALSGCSDSAEAPIDPVSTQEAQALEDAASMLDEQRLPDRRIEEDSQPPAPEE